MQKKLTKRSVDALEPAATRLYFYDTELQGFGLKILPSGVRVFFVQYRTEGGRRGKARRVVIGRYGQITVEQARKHAAKLLAGVAQGADPAAARAAHKTASTVQELGKSFLDDVRARRKSSTAGEYARMWTKHVLPALGSHQARLITPAEVARLHRAMRATPYLANRVLALLGSFFAYAEQQAVGPKHTNPAHEIEFYAEHARERFLTPAETISLGKALERAEHEGVLPAPRRRRKPKTGPTAKHRPKIADSPHPANPFAIAAIRFLLLTGWREREALSLRWSDLNEARRTATLADTKTGRSVRHIGAPAWALLDELPRVKDNPHVFPGRADGSALVEINRVWYAVRHAAELGDVRLHDLRHSFASTAASAGGSLLIIRSLLGHRDTATTQRYAHLLEDPVQAAADATAAQLSALLSHESRAVGRDSAVMARITPTDVARAKEAWRDDAPPEFADLLDAMSLEG